MDGSDWPQTKPYRPSNGSEGADFEARFCDRCKREAKYRRTGDGADGCKIATAVFIYEIDDPKYPKEWVVNLHDPVGMTARCTAFRHEDDPGPSRPRKPRPAPLLDLMLA
jgi:hypothetical protein